MFWRVSNIYYIAPSKLTHMFENNLQKHIMLAIGKLGKTTIFRNNVGMGWTGKSRRISSPVTVKLMPGDVVIQNARPLHAGLCEGSSDLIGWTTKEITADMVGKRIAVFTAVEIKTETGRASQAQLNFISRIRECGGIAGIARNPDEAQNLIENLK